MAVVPRRRKTGVVYYVTNTWKGKAAWERVGTHKRQAEERDRAMKKEIAADSYSPPSTAKSLTLRQFAESWAQKRTNAWSTEERRIIKAYVSERTWFGDLRLDEVRYSHIDRWVDEQKAEKRADGKRRITDKTIANTLGVVYQVFESAIRSELVEKNPCSLERGKLDRTPENEREPYTIAEALVLMRHHAIPWPIRVLNGLCLLTGMRKGEAVARRWRDLDTSAGPLAALKIHDQYDGQPLKTKRPRVTPIHPELAAMLQAWASEGFELWTGRKPTPDDLIVPDYKDGETRPFTRSTALKSFVRYAALAGVRPRTMHATRHTFISLCRRGGASKDVIEKITHNSRGDIVDQYTHLDWKPLCDAVLCLTLDAHQAAHLPTGNSGNSWGPALPSGSEPNAGITENAHSVAGLYARTTERTEAENKLVQKPRQDSRQLTSDDLRASARIRKRSLLQLRLVDPDAARPGLALLDAYEAVLDGRQDATVHALAKAARALHLGDRDGIYSGGKAS
jgi:integrase